MGDAAERILIVDDEPPLLKMMGAYLSRLGYRVDTASSTNKAWSIVQANAEPYAVVVIDATMQGMSMEDLALQVLGRGDSVRVIAASGYPVDMTALDAVAPGRVLFLQKPFTSEMLAGAVRRMIAGQETQL